ncbi:MAG: hypothetical protein AUJ49_06090 [Desulfovibrionaceae bacterium CG1_02_65_16]|nr:MAG: hypothetical protein AUJ49_06090 [Desulfovibrionaceae bacterium CG1_02_65_16]
MTSELIVSLCLFAFVTSITPGPNNALLFASGVNHGIRRTMPHLLGVQLGFAFMQLVIALGVGYVFKTLPGLYPTLRAAGFAYLLYLAWRIGTSTPPDARRADGTSPASETDDATNTPRSIARPMTFLEASAFQWMNPKAVMMCVTAASTYTMPSHPILGALFVTGVFLVAGMPCVGLWVLLGAAMRGFLQDKTRLRVFNVAMAVLLVASMAPMARDMLPAGLF